MKNPVAAKERVVVGPVPDWVAPCPFDLDFRARKTEHLTILLASQQVHAERRQVHYHSAMRLETMQAVQHESQWRLQFEPRNQTVTLHWIRIHRAGKSFEQVDLGKFRFLQRAEGLEGFVIDGWYTMLLVLEDVRPGDILESCYTIESEPLLLPNNCAHVFNLPQNLPVGKFCFAVRFESSRPIQWRASSDALKPAVTQEDADRIWTWTGERQTTPEPEPNIPEWHIAAPWVQVSDCQDWQQIALAMLRAWKETEGDDAIRDIADGLIPDQPALDGFADPDAERLVRVEKALQLVQDQYRYLSVDLEVGGYVPAPPQMVCRRRFGDCKDLSFMLVHLLRQLGVPARPVLVNSRLRKSVGQMLPMPGLFNHVVVEYELRGKKCWVDATVKMQGGGPLNRFIGDFGVGLPIDEQSTGLIDAPRPDPEASLYELKETILLDTRGKPSLLSIVLRTKGVYADSHRQEFGMKGIEEISRERLQICASRYPKATRFGALMYQDDRSANEFALAEVFEVDGILQGNGRTPTCTMSLPPNLALTTLLLPEKQSRLNPFALPQPCNLSHVVEVRSPAIGAAKIKAHDVNSPFIQYNCTHNIQRGVWTTAYKLRTLEDSVPADHMSVYRRTVEEIRQQGGWNLTLGIGNPPPGKPDGFGELPRRAAQSPEAALKVGSSYPFPRSASDALPLGQITGDASPNQSQHSRRRPKYQYQRHKRKRSLKRWLWPALIVIIAAAFLTLIILSMRQDSH